MKNILVLLFALQFSHVNGNAQDKNYQRPKLVVGIVVDQMRWDYLQRFEGRFGSDGFKRLLREGFSFNNTYIPYMPAVTAAGHATIFTGAYPAQHGIVGNDWTERETELPMYCTDDHHVSPVGGSHKQGRMSPLNLQATTIGDQLRMSSNFKSRVFGISIKDRGSILPAGRSGNAAYWFDDSTGNFISSSWYMKELPGWVDRFNEKKYPAQKLREGWKTLYPISSYISSTDDDMPFERNYGKNNGHTFPHTFSERKNNFYEFRQTPFSNTMTFEFAKELILNEKLGKQGETDMLCLSISGTDYIGHLFGPDAVEVEDTYLRLDKDIADFLKALDKYPGIGNYTIFLSADHAAPQSSGYMQERKLSAGSMNAYRIKDTLDAYCTSVFGVKGLVNRYSEYQFYMNRILIRNKGLNSEIISDTITNWLKRRNEVLSVFRLDKFHETILNDEIRQMVHRGYNEKRSGDVQIILKSHYTDYLLTGTDHGSPYNYDTHIPLIWFGAGINRGETFRKVYMTDIAPTVAAMLRIQQPDAAFGQVLTEIVP